MKKSRGERRDFLEMTMSKKDHTNFPSVGIEMNVRVFKIAAPSQISLFSMKTLRFASTRIHIRQSFVRGSFPS